MITICVCVKQIPNPNVPVAFDQETNRLVRTGPLVMDDADSFAVETALRLVEQAGGGQITLVSVSPNSEVDGLYAALAIGGDKATLVSDPALAGLDALGTAKVLAAVATREGADLVITATESTDGYTGTVAVQIAEVLGYPSVTFARGVSIDGKVLEARRQTDRGYDDITCPLPAVISVTNGVEVRYPTFKARMAAKKRPIEELDIKALGLDPAAVDAGAARQEVLTVSGGDDQKANAAGAGPAFAMVFGNEADAQGEDNIITDEDGQAHDTVIQTLASWRAL